jgi:hypothetical protein
VSRITKLEQDLEQEFEKGIREKHLKFRYRIEKGKIAFEQETQMLHKRLRQGVIAFLWESSLASLLIVPVLYSLFVPLILLDLWIWLYQTVCFPVYRITKVERKRYVVLDRGNLGYLNWIERFNCNYCGYANGLIAYAREIASRTEQYFCPIKHARPVSGTDSRYRDFLDFGDGDGYKKELEKLREKLHP